MSGGAAIARQAFDAFNARDPDAFAAAMHPDIVFVPLLTARTTPYRGRDGMRQYVRDAFGWASGVVRIVRTEDLGDVVVLHGVIDVRTPRGALAVEAVYVARVRDGLISELVTLADAGAARDALGIEPSAKAGDLRLDLPAQPESVRVARSAARAYAAAAGLADLHAVALAITEAVTNVVLHAYIDQDTPGTMTLLGRHDRGDVLFCVQDTGRGLLPRPDSPGLGMGLALMQQNAAEISFVGSPQRPRGTEVRLRFSHR